MGKGRHWAIFVDNHSDKSLFIRQLTKGPYPPDFSSLANKKGALFSKLELDRFMEEEERHDHKILTRHTSQNLQSMSSGERKRALLTYLLEDQPDYLVLDNPFDNLDAPFQRSFREMLQQLSPAITMILIISRSEDVLPFITNYSYLNGQELQPVKAPGGQAVSRILPPLFTGAIPPAPEANEPATDPLVELRNVSVTYSDKPIVNGIYWTIRPGEFWQLSGRNGSGKTTLLSMITGDNPKGYGQELYLFGTRKGSGESVWDVKRKIGYFTPAMVDRFRGYHSLENMLISGLTDSIGLYLRPTESQLRVAGDWLVLLGMEGDRHTYFHDLEMGLQRLVMCARAMVKHPPLLILDEPTAGLDDQSASLVVSLVNKLGRESNTAIVFVSHREEPGLKPDAIFNLKMGKEGSKGEVVVPSEKKTQ
jgi:molybdate transport system ATP-binding protein